MHLPSWWCSNTNGVRCCCYICHASPSGRNDNLVVLLTVILSAFCVAAHSTTGHHYNEHHKPKVPEVPETVIWSGAACITTAVLVRTTIYPIAAVI